MRKWAAAAMALALLVLGTSGSAHAARVGWIDQTFEVTETITEIASGGVTAGAVDMFVYLGAGTGPSGTVYSIGGSCQLTAGGVRNYPAQFPSWSFTGLAWGTALDVEGCASVTLSHRVYPSGGAGYRRVTVVFAEAPDVAVPDESSAGQAGSFEPAPNVATAGDPVQTLTGNFAHSRADVVIPGRGPVVAFGRAYNSLDSREGALGPGWTHNYAIRIRKPTGDTTGALLLVGPMGRQDRYTFNATTGLYSPPQGVTTRLLRNADLTFTATHKDRSTWTFDSSGRLTAIRDRHGNESTLTYDGSARLSTISDPAGRGSLTLTYDGNGRLWKVTDWHSPAARVVEYGYDTNTPSRLKTVTDREGKVTTYGYDGTSQRLTSISDDNGHVALTLTYDGSGRVATQKDARGLTTGQQWSFGYVTNGDGTKTTTVTMPVTSYEPSWSPTIADTYDTSGRIVKRAAKPTSSSSEDVVTEYTYDGDGNLATAKDARGFITTFCYDVGDDGTAAIGSWRNLTRRIDPAPTSGGNILVTLLSYDLKDNPTRVVPPKGVTSGTSTGCTTDLSASLNLTYATTLAYDAAKVKLLSISRSYTDPDEGAKTAITKLEYDAGQPGLVSKIIPPRGNTGSSPDYSYATSFSYFGTSSKHGLLQSVADPLGDDVSYDYDASGRPTQVTDPNGHIWSTTYDPEDRVTSQSAPGPQPGDPALITSLTYDGVGNLLKIVDPIGQITKYVYDAQDDLQEVWESPNAWTSANESSPSPKIVTAYAYDHHGNLTRATRAQGESSYERATDYAFDGLGRVRTEKLYPTWPSTAGPLVTQASYDPNGNGTSLVDPLGQTTTLTYDRLDRLTGLSFVDGTPAITYTYDLHGNRLTMVDGTGTASYTYDELDQLTTVTSPGTPSPKTVGYRYDLHGNRRKLIYPGSSAVTYAYDKADQLTTLTDWASRVTSFAYEPDGTLATQTNFNGTKTTYAYDRARWLTDVWNQRGTDTISRHTFTLDKVGNRLTASETLAPLAPTPLQPAPGGLPTGHPMTAGTGPTGLPTGHPMTAGTAPSGLPTRTGPAATMATHTYAYDRLYRLTQASGPTGTTSYGYDSVGNRLTMTRGSVTTTYSYDRADRITSAVSPTSGTSYTVNANGNTTARGADTFAFDQLNRLKQSVVAGSTATYTYDGDGVRVGQTVGAVTTQYVYDVAAGLAYTVASGGSTVEVYHADGLGSVRALTDATGAIVQTYAYDEFGVPTDEDGTREQPIGYTGEPRDQTGLVNLRARMYDPTAGRFLQRDSFAGLAALPLSQNRHAYVDNNPINATDPSGHTPLLLVLAGRCAFGAAIDVAIDAVPDIWNGTTQKITGSRVLRAAATGCISSLLPGSGGATRVARAAPAGGSRLPSAARAASCAVNSFSGDTPVATEHGPRRIDSIRVGELVLAFDEQTGETAYRRVTTIIAHEDPAIVLLTLDGETIRTTPDHPFMVEGRGWTDAADLKPGDRVRRASGGTATVGAATVEQRPQMMYNLSVEGAHTFFVGEAQALVHNDWEVEGRRLAELAGRVWDSRPWPDSTRSATIAVARIDGRYVYAVFHPDRAITEEIIDWLSGELRARRSSARVLGLPSPYVPWRHAEQQLYEAGARGPIGISNPNGMCGACTTWFGNRGAERAVFRRC